MVAKGGRGRVSVPAAALSGSRPYRAATATRGRFERPQFQKPPALPGDKRSVTSRQALFGILAAEPLRDFTR